jgi:hypothetical protein
MVAVWFAGADATGRAEPGNTISLNRAGRGGIP